MLRSILALSILVAPTTLPAQTKDDIVVTARDRETRERQASAFVRQVSPPPVDGQFARWHAPICPVVKGLPDAIAARVAERVRTVAREVGASAAAAGCRGNAFIVFTPDARGLLAAMERRSPRLLVAQSPAERRALRDGGAPVLWWTGTHAEGADGDQFTTMLPTAIGPIGSGGPAIPGEDRARFGNSYRSSIVSTSMRVTIAHAVVLVDVPKATGRRLDAVADYAAFVILARVRQTVPTAGAGTILSLFAGPAGDAPRGLTAADRAYLAGLYAVAADRKAGFQARRIAGFVARRRGAAERD